MGTKIDSGDFVKIVSATAAVALVCSTVVGMIITSGVSLGGEKEKITQNEKRSRQNQEDIRKLRGDVREILVILRERKDAEDKKKKK